MSIDNNGYADMNNEQDNVQAKEQMEVNSNGQPNDQDNRQVCVQRDRQESAHMDGHANNQANSPVSARKYGQVDQRHNAKAIEQMKPQFYVAADKLLLAGALLLGVIFVWFFYDSNPGVSVPLFIIAFYALFFAYNRSELKRDAIFGWFLCLPVLMISSTFFIFNNTILMVLNVLVLPWLILLQTTLVTGVNSYRWYSPGIVGDLLYSAFARCLMHIGKPFGIIKSIIRSRAGGDKKSSVGSRVLAGLVISLPVLLILLLLLSSADMVFGKLVEKLPEFLDSLSFGEVIGKIILALIIFFISFSYVWSVRHGDMFIANSGGAISNKTADEKRRWDPVILITVTAAIDVLYIIFVVIQFAYLFCRSGLPEGFTYSEYARNGFFELIMVSLLNMGMLALTLTFTKKTAARVDALFRILNSVMICCTFIMLTSAYYRMTLYDSAYGFTFLRIMTKAFMIFLFILFTIMLVRVWKESIPLLKPYIAAAVVAFTIINYINVDAMIASKNIDRYCETGKIDISYLRGLSVDASGEIIRLLDDEDPEIAKQAKDMLDRKKKELTQTADWQSFNILRYRAMKKMP